MTDLAAELDGVVAAITVPWLRARWLVPGRYAFSLWPTVRVLTWMRPSAVIVAEPPPFAAVVTLVWAKATGAIVVLDAHPGAFGHRDAVWKLFLPLHKRLVRASDRTLVAVPELAEQVHQYGGRALVLHEAPPSHPPQSTRALVDDPVTIVFAATFDPDEPIECILRAAELLSCHQVRITGDSHRIRRKFATPIRRLPEVAFTDWLDHEAYMSLIGSAHVVVALTVDPLSVMRSAAEAAWLARPTVISDTTNLRAHMSPSVFVTNDPNDVAKGVRDVLQDYPRHMAMARDRQKTLGESWQAQRTALLAALSRPRPAAEQD
jgi:glycosyltransferase involved in cell wall biosynthesis